jgi:hypothetical protein
LINYLNFLLLIYTINRLGRIGFGFAPRIARLADELVISTSLSRARERGQGLNDPNFSSTDDARLGVSGRKTNLVRRVKKLHSTTKVYE